MASAHAKLPDYMLPATLTQLDHIPLTTNGKLDRRALPKPKWNRQHTFVAPRSDLEIKLCALWQQVLGIDEVGIEDHLFHLGGNSILAIRLMALMEHEGLPVKLAALYQASTILALIALLSGVENSHRDDSATRSYQAPRTALEHTLCELYQQILGLTNVGIDDSFFDLGGSPSLAMKLRAKIREQLATAVQLAEIYSHPCVDQLSVLIENQRNGKRLSTLTPHSTAKESLFMLHPGHAGAVYYDLACTLEDKFHCFGINHYNLSHPQPIVTLNALAHHYLERILVQYQVGSPLYLMGWSLGGVLVLEIATQLEQRGIGKIHLLLVDTYTQFEIDGPYASEFLEQQLAVLDIEHHDPEYAAKLRANMRLDRKLASDPLSAILQHSSVHLLQAGMAGGIKRSEAELISQREHINRYLSQSLTFEVLDNYQHQDILGAPRVARFALSWRPNAKVLQQQTSMN